MTVTTTLLVGRNINGAGKDFLDSVGFPVIAVSSQLSRWWLARIVHNIFGITKGFS